MPINLGRAQSILFPARCPTSTRTSLSFNLLIRPSSTYIPTPKPTPKPKAKPPSRLRPPYTHSTHKMSLTTTNGHSHNHNHAQTPSSFPLLNSYFQANKSWASSVKGIPGNSNFFEESAKGQRPEVLWIGCADSRVPESLILNASPGKIFVHRNIANQFQAEDANAGSVLAYAVGALGVEHVVIVGHTGCGGCAAAYASPAPSSDAEATGPLSTFLGPLIALRHSLPEDASVGELIATNVRQGVQRISETAAIRAQWAKSASDGVTPVVYIHGWIYDIGTGLLKDLECTIGPDSMEE